MAKYSLLDVEEDFLLMLWKSHEIREEVAKIPKKEVGPDGKVRRGRAPGSRHRRGRHDTADQPNEDPESAKLSEIAAMLTQAMKDGLPPTQVLVDDTKQTKKSRQSLLKHGAEVRHRKAETEADFQARARNRGNVSSSASVIVSLADRYSDNLRLGPPPQPKLSTPQRHKD